MKNEETSNIQPANTEQRYGAHVLNLSAFPGLSVLTDIALGKFLRKINHLR